MSDRSNFDFARAGWRDLASSASRAERHARQDPRAACFYARLTLERAVHWLYEHDAALPYVSQDSLGALLHEPAFKRLLGRVVWTKAKLLHRLGNDAVHAIRPVPARDGVQAVRELHHVLYWLVRTYTEGSKPSVPGFDETLLPDATGTSLATSAALEAEADALEAERKAKAEARQKRLSDLAEELAAREAALADRAAELARQQAVLDEAQAVLEAQREAERKALAETRQQSERAPDPHDYDEAQTRDFLIDLLLREAGWAFDAGERQGVTREHPVTGMPSKSGRGAVDYVLWGDDGLPLAVVEAKRAKVDMRSGKTQARLYADALERDYGQRPVIFYTNGYETALWDDAQGYPPRDVLGFYTQHELEWLIRQREARKPLGAAKVPTRIAGRTYQMEAIRSVTEALESKRRRSLLVMATGTGKTRTAIALVKLLTDAGWVKRTLFLADRRALLKQARGAFREHVPSLPTANLSKGDDLKGARVVFATYPTMANAIDGLSDGDRARTLTPGMFDLVIVDEAHRSVYNRYRVLFDYFDALLLGLTATPRDEVNRDTYDLFNLRPGDPTFAYELEEAVTDGFLVPPRAVDVPLKFPTSGITYADLSEEEREEYETKLVDEETGAVRSRVESDEVNRWLFNNDTVDKALAMLMERGLRVDGGDRLGKTIIFARNHRHAQFIKERFDLRYPGLGGTFAEVIDSHDAYAEDNLDRFYVPGKEPVIAISVDMLDTGVDVPEVVNLVLFKPVRSRVKFDQMIGRGTRLSTDLFGAERDKTHFLVFDLGGNFAFFGQNPTGAPQSQPVSLSTRLFRERLKLALAFRRLPDADDVDALRTAVLDELHAHVERMNPDSVLVRPHRRLRDAFASRARWDRLSGSDVADLSRELAPLPIEHAEEDQRIRRFDLMIVQAQYALAESDPIPNVLAVRLTDFAQRVAEKQNVKAVREARPALDTLRTPDTYASLSPPELEALRRSVRHLAVYVTPDAVRPVFTDFEDEQGEVREIEQGPYSTLTSVPAYRERVNRYVLEHEGHPVVAKLKNNEPLTKQDLEALESLLFRADAAVSREEFKRAYPDQPSLGTFVRSIVGLDRTAAKNALAEHLDTAAFTSKQIRFIDYLVDELAKSGTVDVGRLYDSPYREIHTDGLDGLFSTKQADAIAQTLHRIWANAGVGS